MLYLREYKKHGRYRAIVIVPTIELVNQWEEEIRRALIIGTFFKVSSQNKNWREELQMVSVLSAEEDRYSFLL